MGVYTNITKENIKDIVKSKNYKIGNFDDFMLYLQDLGIYTVENLKRWQEANGEVFSKEGRIYYAKGTY